MVTPELMFDSLSCLEFLSASYPPVMMSDVHIFCYLGCLLAVYDGTPISQWGYSFVGTSSGAPLSIDLNETLRTAQSLGLLVIDDSDSITPNDGAWMELSLLRELESCRWRAQYIEAATKTLLNFSSGIVRAAVREEPNLRPVAKSGSARLLLEGIGLERLYEQFDALSKASSGATGLFVPASIWLTYLANKAMQPEAQ
jgi:hypothetical protein